MTSFSEPLASGDPEQVLLENHTSSLNAGETPVSSNSLEEILGKTYVPFTPPRSVPLTEVMPEPKQPQLTIPEKATVICVLLESGQPGPQQQGIYVPLHFMIA
jgi:hypothetical protein